jgi:rubredoxin
MQTSATHLRTEQWACLYCGYVYVEATGCPEAGVAPRTHWEDLPEDWCCPMCSADKADFEQL